MTGRDRAVLIVAIVAAVLVGVWLEVVSPERHKATGLVAQVSSAKTQLEAAESQVSGAHAAQSQYAAAYAAMVNLGKAVPAQAEVPSLIDQLTSASSQKSVDFESIASSSTGSSSASASTSTASAATSVFTQLPFTFTFEGTYFDLEHLFRKLTDLTTLDSSGEIEVNGRLLTISSVALTPVASAKEEGSKNETIRLTGTIGASAYVLPESHGVSSPSAASGSAASPAASTAASSATTPAAVVKVNP
jgi:Tfp pilus assembly protein PilO